MALRKALFVVCGMLVLVSGLVWYYQTDDAKGFLAFGFKESNFEKEIERVEAVEDEETRTEESRAGAECATKRLRHPGLIHGMKLQFIHVPKTGGSSIQLALDEWANENPRISLGILNSPSVHGSSFKCPIHSASRTILVGHRGWGFCEDIERDKKGLFTITTIRDAVSRMVSLYDYNLLRRATVRAQRIFANGKTPTRYTLRDLIKQYNSTADVIEPGEAILRYSGSQQARYMCGYECVGPNAFQNQTFTEEYMLERALFNLRRTDCVGITEHLDGLIDQMKLHLKWMPWRFNTWLRQNTVPSTMKSVLDDEAREILSKWGWADQKLYEEAAKIAHEKTHLARKCLAKMKG